MYGVGPGPYLVLPILPPLDVRDAIGFAADAFIDPLAIFITPISADLGRTAGQTINERARNLTLHENAEENALDLYAAVRNGYLQRRRQGLTVRCAIEVGRQVESAGAAANACAAARAPVEVSNPLRLRYNYAPAKLISWRY